jgi:hypothetical protein
MGHASSLTQRRCRLTVLRIFWERSGTAYFIARKTSPRRKAMGNAVQRNH